METFLSPLPVIINNICNNFKDDLYGLDREAMEYNLPLGKKIHGLSVVRNYKALEEPTKLTQENLYLANILGWCAEFNHIGILMKNDILDNSTTRENVSSWYKLKGIINCINDFKTIEILVYHLLKQHFSHLPNYTKMIELMHDITFKTIKGQSLNAMIRLGKTNLTDFTMEKFKTISKYKTTYQTMILPFYLASYLSDKNKPDLFKELDKVFFKLGEYYQIESDFKRCYGENGDNQNNDIKDGKCTWLIVKSLEKADFYQKTILKMNYGKKNDDSVKRVKEMYDILNIFDDYNEHNEELRMFINDNFEFVSKYTCYDLMFDLSSQ